MQESSAAIKAACEQRFGALKLLLAEKVQEVQELQQQASAAHLLAAAKVGCWQCCMRQLEANSLDHSNSNLEATALSLRGAAVDVLLGLAVFFHCRQRTQKPCA
jgi:hypothetical protein